MRPVVVAAFLVASSLAATPVLACKGRTILYRDDFRKITPAWSQNNNSFSIGSGRAQMMPPIGTALIVGAQRRDVRSGGPLRRRGDGRF
jgi:hypothetical protein